MYGFSLGWFFKLSDPDGIIFISKINNLKSTGFICDINQITLNFQTPCPTGSIKFSQGFWQRRIAHIVSLDTIPLFSHVYIGVICDYPPGIANRFNFTETNNTTRITDIKDMHPFKFIR